MTTLDLSHNKFGDKSGMAIGKWIGKKILLKLNESGLR